MSEEEKKAIEKIKLDMSKPLACKEITICDVDDLIKLLNLIEKQQAELDLYNNLKQIEQEHQKINRELREEIDIQIEHNKEIDNMNKILANTIRGDSIIINDSISKDKIREKIEELKSSREFYQNFPDDYMAEISINVLKEFLEE